MGKTVENAFAAALYCLAAMLVCWGINYVVQAFYIGGALSQRILAHGFSDIFGDSSVTHQLTIWAFTLIFWALGGLVAFLALSLFWHGAKIAVPAIANQSVVAIKTGASIVKKEPAFTTIAILAVICTFFTDTCKDYLPGSTPIEKNFFKYAVAIIFFFAGVLWKLKKRVASLCIYLAIPVVMLLLAYNLEGSQLAQEIREIRLHKPIWIFLMLWSGFAVVVAILTYLEPSASTEEVVPNQHTAS